ncbi:MAG: serine/threonine-protein kinase [Polyangiaceae bacterium]
MSAPETLASGAAPSERPLDAPSIDDSGDAFLREVARAPRVAPPERDVDRTGEVLGRFELTKKLGQGGMGVVYAARDRRLGREVALKLLPVGAMGDEARRRAFLREARSASAVNHASIATIYDVGEHAGELFIAMERVEGITLRERLDQCPAGLGAPEAARIVREIARGLAKAHAAGVVHRDLKPENVMIGEGAVKVLDFGLAKLVADPSSPMASAAGTRPDPSGVSQRGRIVGTPRYMSPEQASGGAVDARTDVFAMGVILHELATGQRPPAHGAVSAAAQALRHPLERCLAREPSARYQAVGELIADLDRVLEPRRGSARAWMALPVLSAVGAAIAIGVGVSGAPGGGAAISGAVSPPDVDAVRDARSAPSSSATLPSPPPRASVEAASAVSAASSAKSPSAARAVRSRLDPLGDQK